MDFNQLWHSINESNYGNFYMSPTYYIPAAVVGILSIIAMWKIFTKAGEKGWKCIIPIYNLYILYKITWKPSMFVVMLIISILTGGAVSAYAIIHPTMESNIALFVIFAAVMLVLGVIAAVIAIISMHKLSKAFGHGAGYTVGLIFLSVIFQLILAFGQSKYVGADK